MDIDIKLKIELLIVAIANVMKDCIGKEYIECKG
jgi:hypothetical protein